MIYITKNRDLRAKIYQKFRWESVIHSFCYDAKTTPTVECHRWLNIIRPKTQQSIKVFHEQKLIFQILLTPIIYLLTIISTDLIEKQSSLN